MEKDPTKFCTFEEFETGVDTLRQFCALRCESVRGQLDGTIPSTDEGQDADPDALVDASALTLSDMGSMGGGPGDGGPGGSFPGAEPGGGFPGGGGPGGGAPGGRPGGNGFPGKRESSERPSGDRPSPSDGGEDAASDSRRTDRPQDDDGFSGGPPDFPGGTKEETSGARTLMQSDWTMLGVCFAALLCAILFARKYMSK